MIRRLLERKLVRDGLASYGFTVTILVVNLLTGILIARTLGASGRGELAAITTLTTILMFLFSIGCSRALAYHQARHPEDGARLIGTWLALLVPLGGAAIVAGQLALPALFAGQAESTIELARIYLIALIPLLLAEPFFGVLLGNQDFIFWNVLRLAQPLLVGLAYVVLWRLGELTVPGALITLGAVGLVILAVAALRTVPRHGIGRPSRALARSTLWFGLRGQGATWSAVVNARLDMLLIPAFLGAASVGLYSVATNVAWTISQLSGALWWLVLPSAARRGERGSETVLASMHATILVGTALAVFLAVFAEVLIRAAYGAEFVPAADPLRLMLPGVVFQSTNSMLASGLVAAGRPFTPTFASLLGAAVTIVGLVLFLRSGGLVAAALVTTCAYALVLTATAILYRRAVGLAWRDFLPSPRRWVAQGAGR